MHMLTRDPSLLVTTRTVAVARPTRINIYGDLGVYEWNAMEWLKADCGADAGTSVVDAIVHMGDHAYNEGDDDEKRADAYMNAFQPILASCPWYVHGHTSSHIASYCMAQ